LNKLKSIIKLVCKSCNC